jgi:hypothetical protein
VALDRTIYNKKNEEKRFWEAYTVDSAIDKFRGNIPRVVFTARRHDISQLLRSCMDGVKVCLSVVHSP